jgi:anti-sigma factor ChrR (cupin superfamily)
MTVRSQLFDLNAIPWKPLVPGVSAKRVWADSDGSVARQALFIRFEAGASLPPHTHDGDELVHVLEGEVADDFGGVTAGNVGYRPHGCAHTVHSPGGATAFAVVTGGVSPSAGNDGTGPASQVFDLAAMGWVEALPGVRQKPIWSGADRRLVLTRIEPGASLPPHRHRGDELVFVIEGAVEDEAGAARPGTVGYRPDGCEHTVRSTNGATALAFVWGTVEPL